MPLLPGLHDIESAAIAPADTWILDTVALSDNPPPKTYPANLHCITRLNWGYGSRGTLPVPDQYLMFSQRVALYVQGCTGCHRWIIGNESNLPREYPDGIPIYPWNYVACYRLCRRAIRALAGHEHDEVLIAGSGPWNDELKYDGNHNGDWITYFRDVIDLLNGELDGCSIHSYCHGYDPALVTSTARMDAPFHNRFYNFRCYQDYCDAIPLDLAHLPVYLTEANGDGPWQATGLMPAMLAEINDWNYSQQPKIHCVVFYRYPKYDHFYIEGRDDVLNEYRNAVAIGYQSPDAGEPQPPIEPPVEPPTEPDNADYLIEWDPRLDQRGTQLLVVASNAPTEWHVRVGRWYDKAQAGGRVNVFVSVLDEQGNLIAGVPVSFVNGGKETKLTEIKFDPWLGHEYSLDFAMYNVAPAYSLQIDDEEPSDVLSGLGLGDLENPHHTIHVSYEFVFQRLPRKTEPEPTPTPPHTEYVLPIVGAYLRAAPVDGIELALLEYRTAVTVVNETATQSDGYMWHGVNYGSHYGFIRSDLLDVRQPDAILPPPEPERGELILIWPVQTGRVTQWFGGTDVDYSKWGLRSHDGIDIGAPIGTPVFSVCHGKVVAVGSDPEGFGLFVRVYHEAHGFHSLYGHLSRQTCSVGELVTRGKVIGEVGSTGNSEGPHLHLSFRCGSENDYYRVHTGHKQGASDPMAIYSVINRSDPNLLLP